MDATGTSPQRSQSSYRGGGSCCLLKRRLASERVSLKAKRGSGWRTKRKGAKGPPGEGLSVLGAQLLNQFLQRSQLPPVDQVEFLAGKKNKQTTTKTSELLESVSRHQTCWGTAVRACRLLKEPPKRHYRSHRSCFSEEKFKCFGQQNFLCCVAARYRAVLVAHAVTAVNTWERKTKRDAAAAPSESVLSYTPPKFLL